VVAFKADVVEPVEFGTISLCQHVGWNVLEDTGKTADKGMSSNSAELMNGHDSTDDGIIFNQNVST
jgi:hypothetical protein